MRPVRNRDYSPAMDIFQTLLHSILPLYVIMALGYVTARVSEIDTKTVATLAAFVMSPAVFVLTVSKMVFVPDIIFAPIMVLAICTSLAFAALRLSRLYMADYKTPYLTALMAGTNNWGYFGVPIAFALFDPDLVAVYIVIGFGTMLFENSLGIYFISRGHMSPLDSFKNIFRYPVLYAILLGIFFSLIDYDIPMADEAFFPYFKGAYVVLGMMTIGMALAGQKRLDFDWKVIATAFALRFVAFPLLFFTLIWIDKTALHWISPSFYGPFLLFSLMPMAANNIAFAAKFDMKPEKAAVAALATTLFALAYIPFALRFLEL